MDALETFEAKKKRNKRRKNLVEYDDYKEAINSSTKIKSVIEFDNEKTNSIRSLAIETKSTVSVTTRFMKGKMLMFAKNSVQSFNYDVIEVFMFSDKVVQEIYDQLKIRKCLLLQNLTDTGSTSLTFLFICHEDWNITKTEARNLIFEIMFKSKLHQRLDLADDFYAQFGFQNKKLKKQVGLYEVESISNPNVVTVAINPKEYFEQYKNFSINKKAKGIGHDTAGMTLDAYIDRLSPKEEQLYNKKIL